MDKQKISLIVDNEISIADLPLDDESLMQFKRYHQIGDCLRNSLLSDDFSNNVMKSIHNETTDIKQSKKKGQIIDFSRYLRFASQGLVAASVCFLTVFGVQYYQREEVVSQEITTLDTIPVMTTITPVSFNLNDEIKRIEQDKEREKELEEQKKQKGTSQ